MKFKLCLMILLAFCVVLLTPALNTSSQVFAADPEINIPDPNAAGSGDNTTGDTGGDNTTGDTGGDNTAGDTGGDTNGDTDSNTEPEEDCDEDSGG